MNSALAITSQGKTISHVPSTILSKIKGVLPLVRMLRISVRYHHLGQRKSVENRSNSSLIVVCDIVEHDALLIVEPYMYFPILPINNPSFHLERDSLRLCDVDWLDVFPVASICLDAGYMVVVRLGFADGSANLWDVDMNDLLLVGIENRAEIEGE
jgi:hypothetical protein